MNRVSRFLPAWYPDPGGPDRLGPAPPSKTGVAPRGAVQPQPTALVITRVVLVDGAHPAAAPRTGGPGRGGLTDRPLSGTVTAPGRAQPPPTGHRLVGPQGELREQGQKVLAS